MNLFRLIKLSRELSRMEKKAKANPSPSTFVDLAQVYINLGWHAHTLRVAEEGLVLFPDSDELRKVHGFASRNVQKERVTELREKIAKAPSAKVYRDLAQVYADISDSQMFARDLRGGSAPLSRGCRDAPRDRAREGARLLQIALGR